MSKSLHYFGAEFDVRDGSEKLADCNKRTVRQTTRAPPLSANLMKNLKKTIIVIVQPINPAKRFENVNILLHDMLTKWPTKALWACFQKPTLFFFYYCRVVPILEFVSIT